MLTSSIVVLSIIVLAIILISYYGYKVLGISATSIFTGSGKPIFMAKIVLSHTYIIIQIIFGILIAGIICIMIMEDKIKSEAGLPIVSGIVGYLLGKSFKTKFKNAPKDEKS
jgi:uncharacterized membrane protein YeaQ/YmgE (transglycosylase-associated protein family)